jgi:hypothetical protein
MLYCVSLSKAGAKLRTFSQTPTFTRLFLTFPESFFVRRWKTGMLRGIFFCHTQKEEENMHNNIYCAGGRMCARENTPHYLQKAAQWKNNALSSSKQRHVFT